MFAKVAEHEARVQALNLTADKLAEIKKGFIPLYARLEEVTHDNIFLNYCT